MIRIHKLLADWGVDSRRAIEKLIAEGRITADGETVALGFSVDENDLPEIRINGKIIEAPKNTGNHIYIFNKPEYIVSTVKDELGRKCIADFIPKGMRLYPIGRLDADSTGLLLITDFGELTNRLLHPSYKVEKEYIATVTGKPLTAKEEADFAAGVNLDDGLTLPCKIKRVSRSESKYSVTIREGRNRQVKRMFEFFERKVITLHRVRFGPIGLSDLEEGEMRPLDKRETAALLRAVKLK
jgi:23S rRNA pseudouridine2605 synthase